MAPKKAATPEPEPEPELEPEPEPEETEPPPPVRMLNTTDDWDQVVEDVGDGLLAVLLYAPDRCPASRVISKTFDEIRLDPKFGFALFAAIDIDAAEEYFVTGRGLTTAPTLQFIKNGWMLTQFVGGDELRLRAELTRLGAALRIAG